MLIIKMSPLFHVKFEKSDILSFPMLNYHPTVCASQLLDWRRVVIFVHTYARARTHIVVRTDKFAASAGVWWVLLLFIKSHKYGLYTSTLCFSFALVRTHALSLTQWNYVFFLLYWSWLAVCSLPPLLRDFLTLR